MKKHVLTILLLISPYIYILISVLYFNYSISTVDAAEVCQNLIFIFVCFVVTILIPNMKYAFVIAKSGEDSTVLEYYS
jgi:hypothetical protein